MTPSATRQAVQPVTAAVVVALILAAGACLWASAVRSRATRLAATDRADLAQVQQIADQIRTLRTGPSRATDRELSAAALNAICERAAATATLPPDALVEVIPFAPQRLGRTDYQELATRVTLDAVTAEQLTRFLLAVQADAAAMIAKQLELAVNRTDPAGWDATITFAGLIYAPIDTTR